MGLLTSAFGKRPTSGGWISLASEVSSHRLKGSDLAANLGFVQDGTQLCGLDVLIGR
jgi:hypothetical protein